MYLCRAVVDRFNGATSRGRLFALLALLGALLALLTLLLALLLALLHELLCTRLGRSRTEGGFARQAPAADEDGRHEKKLASRTSQRRHESLPGKRFSV